jgi:hypothetical protein
MTHKTSKTGKTSRLTIYLWRNEKKLRLTHKTSKTVRHVGQLFTFGGMRHMRR